MCGIVGWVGRSGEVALERSLNSISHRGPDARGTWRAHIGPYSVALGHVRLSIVDLTAAANQPFVSGGGEAVIVFNGEIYNHIELRGQLRALGVEFSTQSDTEVLLQAYLHLGRDCLQRLRGMFAFVIVDRSRGRLLAARDGLGIKPLYVIEDPRAGEFAFASEIRALEVLLARRFPVDEESLGEFLLNGFLYEPRTGLTGIGKLPAGGAVEIDLESGAVSRFNFREESAPGSDLASLVSGELALEVEADVPVGIFFSGGVDSSVVAAFSRKDDLEAIFVDYSEAAEHADRSFARKVAADLGIAYREIVHTTGRETVEDILDDFEAVAAGTEEPISDYTYSATRQISRVARAAGYRVMLSGMGGDELFAGYPRHVLARRWSTLRWLRPAAGVVASVLRRRPRWTRRAERLGGFLQASNFGQAYTRLVGYFSYAEVADLLGSTASLATYDERLRMLLLPVAQESFLKQAMHLDRHGFLSHNLTVTDKASMSESLEVRVPLLTEGLAAHAWALQDGQLIKRGSGKQPLKDLLRSRLAAELVDRRKQAFNPPLEDKLKTLGPGVVRELLLGDVLSGRLDTKLVSRLVDEHYTGAADNTYRLWQLMYLAFWLGQRATGRGQSKT